MARIWRAHRAGSVASSADIHVPVVFDSNGVCGACSVMAREHLLELVENTESIELEWNACDVRIRRARHADARRVGPRIRRMASAGPDTTQLPGSLTAAISRPGARCSATSSGPSATATMTPGGAACMSRARADTAVIAVGRSNTPASVAATYSPMLCPASADGRTPYELDQLRKRVFHCEQRGLSVIGAGQVGSAPLEHLRAKVDAELVAEALGAPVEMLGEDRL